ncbi:MAG: response regulator [Planctomycetaceae bacterium]
MSELKKRILIAEDNRVMSSVLRFNLERDGHDVTVAFSGTQAFEFLKNDRFDLLFTDFQMPGMEGNELCRHVREDSRHAGMAIIMCSAKAFEIDIEKLQKEYGIAKVIFKPFSPMVVKQLINELFAIEASLT